MTLLGKTPLIIAKEKVCQVSLTGCFVLSSLSLAYFSQRMKCELYEERQEKIIRRDKILELLESKPQPESEYLYQLESFYPK